MASEADVVQIVAKAVNQLIKPPQKASWGGYQGYFKDPDGYLWEVACNPFFWGGPGDKK
ncbi:hypothetical protein DSCOOX_28710 [Desulfosarcina ovata subsp. ovata]|uniref:Glyoxalase/fosfomycin resistance/dioxygenase domain-containing protein n=1 Tax=Desulfosarcina ovata subsp. ovata TaxID=2752305 RepID=A0A5K8AAY1_9BACT|nr:hypothetical protein DSCOOX_28710 [Desulfosarcina ovata subsp. ovata]